MAPLLKIFIVFLLMLSNVSVAQAVVCTRSVYRGGCAGSNGAVAVRRHVVAVPSRVVVTSAYRHCRWRRGVRVCR
jgi:hypothetical protein